MAPWTGLWGARAGAGAGAYRGTPVVVKMENPNWSISEISPEDAEDEDFLVSGAGAARRRKGGRGKNAKQITWVLLLKAHRAAGCLASLASAAVTLGAGAYRGTPVVVKMENPNWSISEISPEDAEIGRAHV